MLTVSQCKEYLDPQTLKEMSDQEIIQVRDLLYGIAGLTIETLSINKGVIRSDPANNNTRNEL